MLVVLSSPKPIKREAQIINEMFDEGLSVFHLRKPELSISDLELFLHSINPLYYSKIALHQHHDLASIFGIKRLHFTEINRKNKSEETLRDLSRNYTLSSSIHSVSDYQDLPSCFEYCFLSPVFDSISKARYKAQRFNLKAIQKKTSTKLIALGGIDEATCIEASEMGFDGIAVLGAVWNREQKIEAFKLIQKQCTTVVQ